MPDNVYEVAIVGGGPAGLSAALVLGRSRRRVVVCDHGRPRNKTAKAVHGYLGRDGVAPAGLRELGIKECQAYGVHFINAEVASATRSDVSAAALFQLNLNNGEILLARKLLLATGVVDALPDIPHLNEFYGVTVHHCPYCDGWEHSDTRLVALGRGEAAAKLALTLLGWSRHVTCCTHGTSLDPLICKRLAKYGVAIRTELIIALAGNAGLLQEIRFAKGDSLPCDSLFFSAGQSQRSKLPQMLGCECDADGLIAADHKQGSGVRGLYLAGDNDGEVEFAIVAAAEGAVAAIAINAELLSEDFP